MSKFDGTLPAEPEAPHADLIARLRERLSKHPGQITVDRDLIADIREAADALSRPVKERHPMDTAPGETDVLLWFDSRPPLVAALFDGGWVTYDGGLGQPVHDHPVAWTHLGFALSHPVTEEIDPLVGATPEQLAYETVSSSNGWPAWRLMDEASRQRFAERVPALVAEMRAKLALTAALSPPAILPGGTVLVPFQPGVFYNEDLRLTEMLIRDCFTVWHSWGPFKGHAVDVGYDEKGELVGIKIWDDVRKPPAAGHETYPGHDPAAGLPQPDTAGGADERYAGTSAVDWLDNIASIDDMRREVRRCWDEQLPQKALQERIALQRKEIERLTSREAAIRAEATAKERERAETWRRVAIDCLERILKMVEPRSAIAEEAGVALVALKPARKQ